MTVRIRSSGPVFIMSCKKIRPRVRAEQDYWLSFLGLWDLTLPVTEEERLDFLHFDSHGSEEPKARIARYTLPFGESWRGLNPILLGKKHCGLMVNSGIPVPRRPDGTRPGRKKSDQRPGD